MNNPLIVVTNLSKVYGTKVKTEVLKNINLTIKHGSFNWIVGASGSGKTTLLNIISGLDAPTSGEVIINGYDIAKLNDKALAEFRANNLGFVFQFHYLLPEFNALENVLMPLRIQKQKISEVVKEKALTLLETVGLSHVTKNSPKEMSGGEQQRVAIARAIIGDPELIIADEPTGNLDSNNATQIYELLRTLHKTHNKTFLIVTHDKISPRPGDRIITLKDGNILEDETF